MSSSGRSKAPRGGKEDHIDDRTSGAVEESIGKKSEFLSRREFIERIDYESAKNEDRFERIEDRFQKIEDCFQKSDFRLSRLEMRIDEFSCNFNRQVEELKELMIMVFSGVPGREKDYPTVSENTPLPVLLDTKVPDCVNLSVHLDEDYSPVKEEKEEKPVVVATVHFSAACTVPKQIVVEAVEKLELEPIELIVEPRIQFLSEDTRNIKLCAVLDTIAALFQAWPEFSFSDGFPPGPPKKPPPWFGAFTTSIVFLGQL